MEYQVGELAVSRETFGRLGLYVGLLEKWNPKINLVSKTSLSDIWARHIVDSAQLFSLMPTGATSWVDVGSGGGFPGMVIAILAAELAPDLNITLIESDQRKSAFLRTVSRETGCRAAVLAERIEKIERLNADVFSARALADLNRLLDYAKMHLAEGGTCLFPKGLTWEKEVEEARDSWRFNAVPHRSETQANAVILQVNEIEHV